METEELRKQVRAVIAKALRLSSVELPTKADLESVEQWDSLGHLDIIEALTAHFHIDINHGEAVTLVSEDAIVLALQNRVP